MKMIKWTSLFLCFFTAALRTIPVLSSELDFLMCGNSYIYRNDMDVMVQALLTEGLAVDDEDVSVVRFTRSGAQLKQHVDNLANTLSERPWKWVLLQEQSQIPGFWDTVVSNIFEDSLEAVEELNAMIHENGADTVLLMTWGRHSGDSRNLWLYPDFLAMQERLEEGYYRYRNATSTPERPVKIAPVGLAFERIYNSQVAEGLDPTADGSDFSMLFSDGTYLSQQGTYLAACVIYATLTGRDPQYLTWVPLGLNATVRDYLQSVATATVTNFEQLHEQESTTVEVMVEIQFDSYPDEIGWSLRDNDNLDLIVDYTPGHYVWWQYRRHQIREIFTLTKGVSYRFTIFDKHGDGLCCEYGHGYYSIINRDDGTIIANERLMLKEKHEDFMIS